MSDNSRKIIQILAFPVSTVPPKERLYALADDGTVWAAIVQMNSYSGWIDEDQSKISSEGTMWQRISDLPMGGETNDRQRKQCPQGLVR